MILRTEAAFRLGFMGKWDSVWTSNGGHPDRQPFYEVTISLVSIRCKRE